MKKVPWGFSFLHRVIAKPIANNPQSIEPFCRLTSTCWIIKLSSFVLMIAATCFHIVDESTVKCGRLSYTSITPEDDSLLETHTQCLFEMLIIWTNLLVPELHFKSSASISELCRSFWVGNWAASSILASWIGLSESQSPSQISFQQFCLKVEPPQATWKSSLSLWWCTYFLVVFLVKDLMSKIIHTN